MERKFIKPALQAVYLQFRDKDKWFTVMDFNPSEKERLHVYDDEVREYIRLERLNLKITYVDRDIKIDYDLKPGVLVRGNVSDRLRLAIQVIDKWNYMRFDIIVGEDGEPILKFHIRMEDSRHIESIKHNEKSVYKRKEM